MNEKFNPVIVVVAFNRPRSIKRILHSLGKAKIEDSAKLIISIDNDDGRNSEVKEIAEDFQWPYGEKEVRFQESRLGLRKHILQCADLSMEYGSVIILEDDLALSPYFYDYTCRALEYYKGKNEIGGISLYNQPRQEVVQYPFRPLYDDSDMYFIQFPSSLGQAWTADQWKEFREWYDSDPDLNEIGIPDFILGWPASSWKKYFVAFLVLKGKYFAFPQFSFTTNFNDPGTNLKQMVNHEGQSPLRITGGPYRFKDLEESISIYDVNLELRADCLKKLSPQLADYDFEVDLYATRDLDKVKTPYLITTRPSVNALMGFTRAMKPHEMNIIAGVEGDEIVLSKLEDVRPVSSKYEAAIDNYKYFYTRNPLGIGTLLRHYIRKYRQRFGI